MSAYLIARMTITDMDRYKEYMAASPSVVAKYGGKFIVRGGDKVTFEGEDEARRIAIIEFPSMEKAKAFYHSPEYTAARKLRAGAAEMSLMVVEGVEA